MAYVRKNVSKLTRTERRRFIEAMLMVKRRGEYDEFVRLHIAHFVGDGDRGLRAAHMTPSFLPWHRRFLIQFEQQLQAVDPSVALPYWDWTADRTAASSLWAADFLGGTGRSRDGQVTDGPFAFAAGKWPVSIRVDGRGYLRCGTAIRKAEQGDGSRERPTYWCPGCQSGPIP